jgi:hypothetical protein
MQPGDQMHPILVVHVDADWLLQAKFIDGLGKGFNPAGVHRAMPWAYDNAVSEDLADVHFTPPSGMFLRAGTEARQRHAQGEPRSMP